MENDGEHVTGRRLDVNGGNLIFFRGTEPKGMYGNSKRNDQDMLEFVRTQEQKLKLEKLKWLENDAKITSLQKHPTNQPAKLTPVSKVLPKQKPNDIDIKKPVKEKPNPKHIADVIDNRNKRASQWLHKEQQEYQAKKAEILEHKRAAKELDERRRAAKYAEIERKKLKQFQILQEDPIVASMIPSDHELEIGKSQNSLSYHITTAPIGNSGQPVGETELHESDINNNDAILQLAKQLQLPEQPENELLLIHKRPYVPRLSKSYVNKSIFDTVGQTLELPPTSTTTDNTTTHINNNEQLTSPILKPRRNIQNTKKPSTYHTDSDDYDQDDDFETAVDNPGQDADLLKVNTSLVRKTLQSDRYSNTSNREGKGSHMNGQDEQLSDNNDIGDNNMHHIDSITQREFDEVKKRRLIGSTYAKKRRMEQQRQEAENRRRKALEEEKRLQALEELKNRVVSINKRTKHSTTSSSSINSNSNTTTAMRSQQQQSHVHNSVPMVSDTLHSYATHTPEPTQTLIRALLSSPDVNLTETALPISSTITDNINTMTTNHYSSSPERVNRISPKSSPARRYLEQTDEEKEPSDHPRYFDLDNPRQWQEFLDREEFKRLQLEAKKVESIAKDTEYSIAATTAGATTPPTKDMMKSNSIPNSLQSSSNQRIPATSNVRTIPRTTTAKRPTPPPFRFSSQHSTTKPTVSTSKDSTIPNTNQTLGRRTSSGRQEHPRSTTSTKGIPRNTTTTITLSKRKLIPPNDRINTAATTIVSGKRKTQTQSRSHSTGSSGLSQRKQRNSIANKSKPWDERPPTRARSTGRSRSVMHEHDFDQDFIYTNDALDLFDRQQYTHSSDDEVELEEEEEFSSVPISSAHIKNNKANTSTNMTQPYISNGYLSKSPVRGYIQSEDEYISSGLKHPSSIHNLVFNQNEENNNQVLKEQQLITELSSQAISNFEHVTKTLQNVDRWCNIAHQESLQLQESLRIRDSIENLHNSNNIIDLIDKHEKVSRTGTPTQDMSFHSETSFQSDHPLEHSLLRNSTVFSPPDPQDINTIRQSLTGRLTSRAQELFTDTSTGSSSSEDSHPEEDQQAAVVTTVPSNPSKVSNSVEEWRKQNEAIRASHRAVMRPSPAVASQESILSHTIQRQPSLEESEDSVLMGEIVDSPCKAMSGEDGERSPSSDEDTDYKHLVAKFEHKLSGPIPPTSSNASNMILLNTSQPDRPIIWTPSGVSSSMQQDQPPYTRAEVFSTGDPLLAQQLGMTSDRNEILSRYGQLDMSTTQSDRGSRKSTTLPVGMGSPNHYQHSRNDDEDEMEEEEEQEGDNGTHQGEEEDWTEPYTRSTIHPKGGSTSTTTATKESSYKPSLRNVGELAGLLRKTYNAELETEAGRSALLDTTDSDSDMGSDDSSEIGGDYNNFSAVSIMAAQMMKKQAELLYKKECELEAKAQSTHVSDDVDMKKMSVSRSVDAPGADELPNEAVEEEPFWAETLVKPEWQLPAEVEEGDEVNLEEFLHDHMMNLRYNVKNTEEIEENLDIPIRPPLHTITTQSTSHKKDNTTAHISTDTPPITTTTTPSIPKNRYSGAEMRIRMMEELHKQEELFNYTLELAELEKSHAMQQARDLALQAQQHSSEEFLLLKQRQEEEIQKIAYENSIALSLVNAQNILDKQSSEQREQLIQMEAQLGTQEMFKEYQALLHQADTVAGSLEHNQKLLEMEKLLHADKAREIISNLESKHAAEKASMMVAHAEIQKKHAEALVEVSRASMEHQKQSQNNMEVLTTRVSHDYSILQQQLLLQKQQLHQQQHESLRTTPHTSQLSHPASSSERYQHSDEEDYEDEYSEHFETDASISMRSKTGMNKNMKPRFDVSESESIPEDDVEAAEVVSDRERDHSLSVTDSLTFSPPAKQWRQQRPLHQSMDSVRSSVHSVSATDRHSAGGRYSVSATADESSAEEVEDEVEHSASMGEIAEESAFESYAETASPAAKTSNRASAAAQSYSYSQSDHDFEVSERSGHAGDAAQSYSQSSRAFEVSERSGRAGDAAQSYSQSSRAFEVSEQSGRAGDAAQSYSQSSRAFEVSEQSRKTAVRPDQSHFYESHSNGGDFEVEDSAEQSTDSIADEVSEAEDSKEAAAVEASADEEYDSYSDTFEGSGSRASKIASTITSSSGAVISTKQQQTATRISKTTNPTANTTATTHTINPIVNLQASNDSEASNTSTSFKPDNIHAVLDEYRKDMENRLRGQEKTYKLKVQFIKAKQKQRLEWLNQVKKNQKININDITDEEQKINDIYTEEYSEIEREKWSLHARAYKELRKFKKLKKDLLSFQINIQDSKKATEELEENLLLNHTNNLSITSMQRNKRKIKRENSITTSSSSGFGFPSTTFIAPSRLNINTYEKRIENNVNNMEQNKESEDDQYEEEDFEKTFSTAASSPKAKKDSSAPTAAAVEDSISYSQTYETSVSARPSSTLARHTAEQPVGDAASEVSSEIAEEIIEEESEQENVVQRDEEHSATYSDKDLQPSVQATLPLPTTTTETIENNLPESEYESEFEEPTLVDTTVQSAPVNAAEDASHKARPEMNDSDDYEEDFAQESDQASEGHPGFTKHTQQGQPTSTVTEAVPVVQEEKEEESEIESEVESEISVYGQASGSSDEPYYTSTSPTKETHQQDFGASEQQPDSSHVVAVADALDDDDHSEHSVEKTGGLEEMSAESPVRIETTADQLESSFRSARSGGSASVLEDEDEVNYGDDDFAEYESDHEAELEKQEQSADKPSPEAEVPGGSSSPVKAQPSVESDAEEMESIVTSIAEEEEEIVGEGSDDQSEDYIATSRASLSLQPPTETQTDTDAVVVVDTQGISPLQDMPALDEASPLPAPSLGSASSHLSALSSPDKLTSLPGKDTLNPKGEPDMEYWGSEDFLESPAVTELYRKTSEILLKQSSSSGHTEDALSVDREEGPNGMRYDPDQQRWIGGEDVSLGGFEESVKADFTAQQTMPAHSNDDYAELDTSIEEDIPEKRRNQEGNDSMSSSDDEFVTHKPGESTQKPNKDDVATDVPVAGSAHHSDEEEEEYASDEFSVEEAEETDNGAVSATSAAFPEPETLVPADVDKQRLDSDEAENVIPSQPLSIAAAVEEPPSQSVHESESEIEEDYAFDEFSVGDDDQEDFVRSSPEKVPVEAADDDQEDSVRSAPKKAPVEAADDDQVVSARSSPEKAPVEAADDAQEDSVRSSPEKAPVETADDDQEVSVRSSPEKALVETADDDQEVSIRSSPEKAPVGTADDAQEDSVRSSPEKARVENIPVEDTAGEERMAVEEGIEEEIPEDLEESIAEDSAPPSEEGQEDSHHSDSMLEAGDTRQVEVSQDVSEQPKDTTGSVVPAVQEVDDAVDVKEDRSADMSGLMAELQEDDSAMAQSISEDALQVSAEYTEEGSLTDLTFDYIEAKRDSSAVSVPRPEQAGQSTEDSLLDAVLDLSFDDEQKHTHSSSGSGNVGMLSSEATEFAELSDVHTDFIEVVKPVDDHISTPLEVSTESVEQVTMPTTSESKNEEKAEEEARLVLVEDVTESVLTSLLESNIQRVFAMIPEAVAHFSTEFQHSVQKESTQLTSQTTAVLSDAKEVNATTTISASSAKEEQALESSTDSKEEAALQEAAEHLAETILLHSSKFQRDHQSEDKVTEEKTTERSSLPSLSATRSNSSLPPVLGRPSRSSVEIGDKDGDSSTSKFERPVEFGDDEEELYEFNIPTHKSSAVGTGVHALHGSEDPTSLITNTNSTAQDEEVAGASVIAAVEAVEAVKTKCAQVVAETKAYIDETLLQPELYLAIKLADPNFTGRFIEGIPVIPEEEQLDAPPQPGLIHRAALNDRMNELCDEIYDARHNPSFAQALPLSKRLLLQALPLREETLHAHILKNILQEQEEPLHLLQQQASYNTTTTTTTTADQHMRDIPVQVDIIDAYKYEAENEIKQASEQMADALLARCIIELCADLGETYDLKTIFP